MTKQRRYMVRLCDRIMKLIDRSNAYAFDKADIAKAMWFKSTTNVSEALGMLYSQEKIRRIAAGCKNARRLESAPALYAKK